MAKNSSNHLQLFLNQKFVEYNESEDQNLDNIKFRFGVNLLIGANNSRKSRFLRKIFTLNELAFGEKDHYKQIVKVAESLDEFIFKIHSISFHITNRLSVSTQNARSFLPDEILNFFSNRNFRKKFSYGQGDFESYKNSISKFLSECSKNNYESLIEKFSELNILLAALMLPFKGNSSEYESLKNYLEVDIKKKDGNRVSTLHTYPEEMRNLSLEINTFLKEKLTFQSIERIYIPTLRGLNQIYLRDQKIDDNVYSYTTKDRYNLELESVVFTGLDLYTNIKKVRNSPREVRKGFEDFEKFLGDHFFGGKEIEIVALEEGYKEIQVYIENDSDRKLHELGDGIQALILLLFPIFTAENNSWILIDEPELHMHPGLQGLFFKTLVENIHISRKNLKFIMCTHSNHLMDMALRYPDKSYVYSFENKVGKKCSIVKKIESGKTEVLDLLGVQNSSVFLANCSLWVEGLTDRKYLKAFLKAYESHHNQSSVLIENYHYCFFEYAGSNLGHYLFEDDSMDSEINAYFISNRIFLLSDEDERKEDKHKKYRAIQAPFHYETTGGIEIENIISSSILNLFIESKFKQDEQFTIQKDTVLKKRLGNELENRLKIKGSSRVVKEKSGTLKTYYKNKLADFVLDGVKEGTITWEMISENTNAVRICSSLIKFIKENNPNEFDV